MITVLAVAGLYMMANDLSVITGINLRIVVLPIVATFIYFRFLGKA